MMTSLLALNALNFFMADVRDGLGPFLGVFLQGKGWPPAEIGLVMTIGGYAGMVPFTRVGTLAYIGGCAKVNQDVPPYMLVDGNLATVRGVNAVGLRRAGVGPLERRALRDAHRLLYRSGLTPGAAIERIRHDVEPTPQIKELVAFVEASRRGIARPPHGDVADDDVETVD